MTQIRWLAQMSILPLSSSANMPPITLLLYVGDRAAFETIMVFASCMNKHELQWSVTLPPGFQVQDFMYSTFCQSLAPEKISHLCTQRRSGGRRELWETLSALCDSIRYIPKGESGKSDAEPFQTMRLHLVLSYIFVSFINHLLIIFLDISLSM